MIQTSHILLEKQDLGGKRQLMHLQEFVVIDQYSQSKSVCFMLLNLEWHLAVFKVQKHSDFLHSLFLDFEPLRDFFGLWVAEFGPDTQALLGSLWVYLVLLAH